MNGFVSRAFGGRRRVPEELAARIPPGQYNETGFPVLTAGPTPQVEPDRWRFGIDGMVGQERRWTWSEFASLPFEDVPCDIHCVTKWSKLGTSFRGVSVDLLLESAQPQGAFATAYSFGGYTTNLPLADLTGRQGVGGHRARGGAAPAPARRARAAARASPVLLKERQVGRGPAHHGPRRAGLLGAERLPHPRRSLEGGALLERLMEVSQRAPGRWQLATVTAIKRETPSVSSFRLALPMWMAHLPGQHYDVRLTAPDGYSAQRSYSVASSPLDEGEIELTVDRLADGEVSPYFHDVVEEGDQLEIRGPFASYFVWRGQAPVLLLGGGSGVVPLMAILRHRRRTMPELPMRLLYSVRTAEDVIYAGELSGDALLTFSREPPDDWTGHTGRIDAAMIADAGVNGSGIAFVCGSNGFVETAGGLLMDAGFGPQQVLTERFGPTG